MTDPNPKLERLIDEASRDDLARLLRALIAAEPHLIYPVIGALEGKRVSAHDDPAAWDRLHQERRP